MLCAIAFALPLASRAAAQQFLLPDDHFLCYGAKTAAGDLAVPSGLEVTLSDQFESARTYGVGAPLGLCNPADTDGAGIVDALTHLTAYPIRLAAGQPPHVPVTNVRVFNALGNFYVDTSHEDRILWAAHIDAAGGPVTAPDRTTHDVDNYKCYRVHHAAGGAKFPRGLQASASDAFHSAATTYDLENPRLLCNPVASPGEPIKNGDGHFLCYRAAPHAGAPRAARRSDISTADDFVIHKVGTRGEDLFCVPSLVNPPAEFCGDGIINGSETCEHTSDCPADQLCNSTCQCQYPALGTRIFSLSSSSQFFTSFLPTVALGTPRGTLVLSGGLRDATDTAPVTVSGPVYVTVDISVGTSQTICTQILSCSGSIHCSGGFNVDATDTLDSLAASQPGCVQDGTNSCPALPSSVCCSNSCEGVGVGSGNTNAVALGVNATDSGPGAAALTCSMRGLINMPLGTDCSTQDYSSSPIATRVITTGTSTSVVLDHCAGSGAPASVVPTFSLTGQNFDCATWSVENGVGSFAFTPPTEEPTTLVGGDGANGFRYKD